jgi:hypothetical protein
MCLRLGQLNIPTSPECKAWEKRWSCTENHHRGPYSSSGKNHLSLEEVWLGWIDSPAGPQRAPNFHAFQFFELHVFPIWNKQLWDQKDLSSQFIPSTFLKMDNINIYYMYYTFYNINIFSFTCFLFVHCTEVWSWTSCSLSSPQFTYLL